MQCHGADDGDDDEVDDGDVDGEDDVGNTTEVDLEKNKGWKSQPPSQLNSKLKL